MGTGSRNQSVPCWRIQEFSRALLFCNRKIVDRVSPNRSRMDFILSIYKFVCENFFAFLILLNSVLGENDLTTVLLLNLAPVERILGFVWAMFLRNTWICWSNELIGRRVVLVLLLECIRDGLSGERVVKQIVFVAREESNVVYIVVVLLLHEFTEGILSSQREAAKCPHVHFSLFRGDHSESTHAMSHVQFECLLSNFIQFLVKSLLWESRELLGVSSS
mmetsp:Transcript_5924/g.22470  ORF Transcript_5924/g.22470 Transcript_5924/m.22470 type:complete len:220 (-) Transcript_5924:7546-8205(-)